MKNAGGGELLPSSLLTPEAEKATMVARRTGKSDEKGPFRRRAPLLPNGRGSTAKAIRCQTPPGCHHAALFATEERGKHCRIAVPRYCRRGEKRRKTEEKAAACRPAAPTRRRKNRRREARAGVALPASFSVVAAVTHRPARRRDGHCWFNITSPGKQGRRLQNKSGGGTSDGHSATEGPIVADKNCVIIHYMAPNIYCCGAGTAADTKAVTVTKDMFQLLWFLKRNGAHSVYMALRRWGDGTVMNSMNGSTMALSSAIDLPPGYHQYKFLVDGTWQVDEEQLRVIDEHGVINNLI
nr:sucrose nonfermenting 4-like protein isoform X1 [Ipomoea batatas]